jgi:hypothetical protein
LTLRQIEQQHIIIIPITDVNYIDSFTMHFNAIEQNKQEPQPSSSTFSYFQSQGGRML